MNAPVRAPAPDRVGVAAILIGTGVIAWSAVIVRFLDVGPLAGAAWRTGLACPALYAWAQVLGRHATSAPDLRRLWLPLLLAGLAFACDVGAFNVAIFNTTVANASFIGNVAPILAVLGGALFFREHPPARIWFALALALAGAWVMAGAASFAHIRAGDLFALFAAVAYASYVLLIKKLRVALDGPSATLWAAAVSTVVLVIVALLRGEILLPSTLHGWVAVFALGFGSHAMGQGLTSVALGRAPVGLVALVILAQPPVTALLAWTVLGEGMSGAQLAGGAIILAAMALARPV